MAEYPVEGCVEAGQLADRQRVELHDGGWVWLAELDHA
jgi:hypothetical protein